MRKNDAKAENDLLKTKDVSRLLGIPLSTLYRLSKQGRIKSVQVGAKWLYPKSEIEKYLFFSQSPRHAVRINDEPQERRLSPRMNCNLLCNYSISIPLYKEFSSQTGYIRNIGCGGVFLYDLSSKLAEINIDDPIKLVFSMPNGILRLGGRVVRRNENGINVYGVGIKFRELGKDAQDKIVKYVG